MVKVCKMDDNNCFFPFRELILKIWNEKVQCFPPERLIILLSKTFTHITLWTKMTYKTDKKSTPITQTDQKKKCQLSSQISDTEDVTRLQVPMVTWTWQVHKWRNFTHVDNPWQQCAVMRTSYIYKLRQLTQDPRIATSTDLKWPAGLYIFLWRLSQGHLSDNEISEVLNVFDQVVSNK